MRILRADAKALLKDRTWAGDDPPAEGKPGSSKPDPTPGRRKRPPAGGGL